MIVNLSDSVGIYLNSAESELYASAQMHAISADSLDEEQMQSARMLVEKSIFRRKKINGKLYYVVDKK